MYDKHIPLLLLGLMIAVKFWAVQSDMMPHVFVGFYRLIPSKAAAFNKLDA